MDIIQEIIEAVDDYTRLHYEPPNKIYLARKTFFEVMDKTKEYVICHCVMTNTDCPERKYEICGMKVGLSRHIKDGFCVVNEFL